MAVKASATITLSFMIDIKATYRYYRLQSSTAAVPSKPTTNPPPSGWDDAEPTYTSGSTNTLYFVDLTVFTDDSFLYSPVSKSTSYEAAKEAYNKAVNAQNSVDNMEIGSRNLLKFTENLPISTDLTQGVRCYKIANQLTSTDEGAKLTFNGDNGSAFQVPLSFDGAFGSGEEVTISFDYRGNVDDFGNMFIMQATTPNVSLTLDDPTSISATAWNHYKMTFSHADANVRTNQSLLIFYGLSKYDNTKWVEIRRKSLKLEIGSKATDWTPAPEDVRSDINNAQSTADKAQSDVNSAVTRLNSAEMIIDSLKANISMLVTDSNGTSLMEQQGDGWVFKTTAIQNAIDKSMSDIGDLSQVVGDVQQTVFLINKAITDLQATSPYVRVGEYEGEPCIELGKVDNDFKLMITNTRIMFMVGSDNPTYIDATGLITRNIEVKGDLKQDYFVTSVRANGNRGTKWVGGANLLSDSNIDYVYYMNLSGHTWTQTAADSASSVTLKISLMNSSNTSLTWLYWGTVSSIGKISFVFNISSDILSQTTKLLVGLNGSGRDTFIRYNFSPPTAGDYAFQMDILNLTQGSISWRNVKVEKGSVETPWCPHVNDVG